MSIDPSSILLFLLFSSFLLCVRSDESPAGDKSSVGYNSQQHPYEMLVISSNDPKDTTTSDHRPLMPIWAYKLVAGYLLFISVMGLILNTIVVLVLLNDQQKMTPLNWMLLNLACSDGISAGFGAPISTAAAFNSGWPFSQELCAAYAMIISTAGIGSITTLSALAIYRCRIVVQNQIYSSNRFTAFANHSVRLGCHKAAILLTLIWSYVLIVTSPPIFGWGNYEREAAHISCSVNWELKIGSNRSYIFYMFTFGLIVPMIVICVCYSNILRAVRKVKTEIKKGANLIESSTRHLHQKQLSFQSEAAEKRSTLMVAVMIGAFLVAWTPYSILALIETFRGKNYETNSSISPILTIIPSLFAKTSSVLNPIIYGFLNTQFKLAWEKMTLRFLNRRQNSQSLPRSFLSSCATGLTITHITVKPSVIYHLQTKELAEGYQLQENGCHQHRPQPSPQVQIDDWQELTPSTLSLSDCRKEEKTKSIGMKEEEQQEQPVLLVVVRYVSSSIIHRIHSHTSAGNLTSPKRC